MPFIWSATDVVFRMIIGKIFENFLGFLIDCVGNHFIFMRICDKANNKPASEMVKTF